MYITKRRLSRRMALRGMGAAISLPFLEAMIPAQTFGASRGTRPDRLICIEMVHGAAGSNAFGASENLWAPVAEGSEFDLEPSSLLPLDPYREHLTIVSNTDVRNAEAFEPREVGGDHFRSSAVFPP